jgi:peroxiredoxin
VLVVVSSRSDTVAQRVGWRFPTLVDEGALIHGMVGGGDAEAKPAPAVFVTDRFREIYAAWHGSELPRAQEVLDWLIFINIQCPECGWPEWPA